jgi:hypothetical protein
VNPRYLYAVVSLISWGCGLYLAYRAWSWWSIVWFLGCVLAGLVVDVIIGFVAGDFRSS